jgi:hypothetical protein
MEVCSHGFQMQITPPKSWSGVWTSGCQTNVLMYMSQYQVPSPYSHVDSRTRTRPKPNPQTHLVDIPIRNLFECCVAVHYQ